MGRRKQYLMSLTVRRVKHLFGYSRDLNQLQLWLNTQSARALARLARGHWSTFIYTCENHMT